MNLMQILEKLSIPRPGHSEALEKTTQFLKELLTSWNIPYSVQQFPIRYHYHFLLGISILVLSLLFAFFIYSRKPIAALVMVIAVVGLLYSETEVHYPIVSRLIDKPTENIVVNFEAEKPSRELIFAAHYDSKTDVWDHIQRGYIQKLFPLFLGICVLLCLWAFFANRIEVLGRSPVSFIAGGITICYVIYAGFVFSWLGGYIFLSEQSHSPGAIDNGAGVVVLTALAKEIKEGKVDTGDSNVVILLSSAEETGLQGAHHYIRQRLKEKQEASDPKPSLVNLELLGQNGNLYYEKRSFSGFLSSFPSDPDLIDRVDSVWKKMTGVPATAEEGGVSDAFVFLKAGIPSVTIGHTGLPGLGFGGFHCPDDNMDRVNPENLSLGLELLKNYIESYNQE